VRRTMTLPDEGAYGRLVGLVGTVNRDPVFGRPARGLWFKGVDLSRTPLVVDLHFAPFFQDGPCVAEDWSEIEPSLPLAT
jgi:hypothetical protein